MMLYCFILNFAEAYDFVFYLFNVTSLPTPNASFFSYLEVRGLMNKRHVQEGHEQVRQALAEYCVSAHPQIQVIKSFIISLIIH